MKIGKITINFGVAVIIFGIIFYLQGNSIVGPTTSFMYSNPKWILNGILIAISGGVIMGMGIVINLRRPK
ncbi:MAG: hypothetical protein ABI340_07530 [Nitrososphaera sp.]|jgi:hypothetical protein